MSELLDAIRLIYVVDDQAARDTAHLESVLEAGVTMLWLRVPDAPGHKLYELGLGLRALTRRLGRALVVGDRADVARAVEADGVQLGHRAPPAEALRGQIPGWMGVSCHGEEALRDGALAGANYLVLSPVRSVPGKGAPLGLERFQALRAGVDRPVVALGGIDVDIGEEVRRRGADGVAVIRALRDAPDPASAARRLCAGMTSS